MKRIVLLFVLLCAGFSFAAAQDLITTRRGEDIQAKVMEVGIATVKYIKTSNPDGPVYTVPRGDILMIRFANGEKELFYEEPLCYATVPVREGMRYKEYKRFYNKRDYICQADDPYSPWLAGWASYFIPGLGQCVCGEWGRGLSFFLGTYLTGSMAIASLAECTACYVYDEQDYCYDSYNRDCSGAVALLLAAGTIYVWNICDAVKVAKIKNMYYQDMYGRRQEIKLHIEPYVDYKPISISPMANLSSGVSLKLNF